jgi:hypothetical protein
MWVNNQITQLPGGMCGVTKTINIKKVAGSKWISTGMFGWTMPHCQNSMAYWEHLLNFVVFVHRWERCVE